MIYFYCTHPLQFLQDFRVEIVLFLVGISALCYLASCAACKRCQQRMREADEESDEESGGESEGK